MRFHVRAQSACDVGQGVFDESVFEAFAEFFSEVSGVFDPLCEPAAFSEGVWGEQS